LAKGDVDRLIMSYAKEILLISSLSYSRGGSMRHEVGPAGALGPHFVEGQIVGVSTIRESDVVFIGCPL